MNGCERGQARVRAWGSEEMTARLPWEGLGAAGDGAEGQPGCAGCSAWPVGLQGEAGTEGTLGWQGFNPASLLLSCFSLLVGGENGTHVGNGVGRLKLLPWPALLGVASVCPSIWHPHFGQGW